MKFYREGGETRMGISLFQASYAMENDEKFPERETKLKDGGETSSTEF